MYSIFVVTSWPKWLEDYMVRRNLNNKGLAKLLGVSQSTVGNWLAGGKPEAEKIVKLAELAGDKPVDLFAVIYELLDQVEGAERTPALPNPIEQDIHLILSNRSDVEVMAAYALFKAFFDQLDRRAQGLNEQDTSGDRGAVARADGS